MTKKIEYCKILMIILIISITFYFKKERIILIELKDEINNVKKYYNLNNKGILN